MEFFELKKIISDFLLPLPFFLTLGFLGLLRITFIGRGFFSLLAILTSFVGIFLAAFAPISDNLMHSLENKHFAKKNFPKETFLYIIVLGGGSHEYEGLSALENLSNSSLRRLLEGVRLYKEYPGSRMVFSGYAGSNERTMAEMYSAAAQSLGVIREDIDLLEKPRDTAEEAEELKILIDEKKRAQIEKAKKEKEEVEVKEFTYVLVTSAYHMDRALLEFKKQGLNPTPIATGYGFIPKTEETWRYYVPRGRHIKTTEHFWHETLGSLWQKIRGV